MSVNLSKRTRRKRIANINLFEVWQDHIRRYGYHHNTVFEAHLRTLVVDRDVDAMHWCGSCLRPLADGDEINVGHEDDDEIACQTCVDNYYRSCADCHTLCRSMTWTTLDTPVCVACRDESYSYCQECDVWHPHADAEDHTHGRCQCEAPAQVFAIRNDGEEPLFNDTRVTVTLPAGIISPEGLYEIANEIRRYSNVVEEPIERQKVWQTSYNVDSLGNEWQTKEGNFTKRLSRMAYKECGVKLPPSLISRVGCIARDHSTAIDHTIEVTRNLNLPAADFAHEDSCWWQSYSASRCLLKNNGGFGLRTFNGDGYVVGRAWVLPLKSNGYGRLRPTFETLKPDAFMVFNGYGNLDGYTPARMLAHMAGMTYRKIGFTCSPMYVNNDSGYLVAPEEVAEPFTDGSLNYEDEEPHSDLFATEQSIITLFDEPSVDANERVLTNA